MSMWGHGGLYGDWCDYLQRWATALRALDERPPALAREDFDSDTWVRLMVRIQDAVNVRLSRWSDGLLRHLGEARDEFSWGRALSQARDGLRTILALCDLDELPSEVRDSLSAQIKGVITSSQQQLEDDAQRDLRGSNARDAEMRLRQLRRNPLTAALIAQPATFASAFGQTTAQAFGPLPGAPEGSGRKRQILIDPVGDR